MNSFFALRSGLKGCCVCTYVGRLMRLDCREAHRSQPEQQLASQILLPIFSDGVCEMDKLCCPGSRRTKI